MSNSNVQTNSVPLAEVLMQISVELGSIAETVNIVESTVCRIIADNKVIDRNAMHDLQGIDVITQSLLAIASFSQNLSHTVSANWSVDTTFAANGISLADLARRLKCQEADPPKGNLGVTGEWEAFD